jgi:tRNA(fMet)-specific endonuclease VapC
MPWLLDTNVIFAVARDPRGPEGRRLRLLPRGEAVTSIIVVGELAFGLAKNPSEEVERQLTSILGGIPIHPLEEPVERHYGWIRATLERAGTPIGSNDYWIAAHAFALDCTLVTADEREFRRVPGLRVQNWAT